MTNFSSGAGSAASDLTNGGVEKVRETISRGYDQARDQIESVIGAARKNLRHADGYLRDQIRDRPMTAAATAVGIGFVLGVLLSGRRA